jgi:hypothetical protein
VVLTLSFVDQNGTPLNKFIRYQNIDKLLTNDLRTLECSFTSGFTDGGTIVKQ